MQQDEKRHEECGYDIDWKRHHESGGDPFAQYPEGTFRVQNAHSNRRQQIKKSENVPENEIASHGPVTPQRNSEPESKCGRQNVAKTRGYGELSRQSA